MKTFISLDITHLPVIREALREYIQIHGGNTHNSVDQAREAVKFINESLNHPIKMEKYPSLLEDK